MSQMSQFKTRINEARANRRLIDAVHTNTLRKVKQRIEALGQLRDFEVIRDTAAAIKQHTLDHLPDYIQQFCEQVTAHGGVVHFAPDAEAARKIVCEIAQSRSLKLAVKAKSMTTEEVHLNDALEAIGLEVCETDLGEFIVQIDHDRPSHIVTPIIHKDRKQVAEAMVRELGCEYSEDPEELTMIARRYLREKFKKCDLGITGVNFAVAENGTICLLTNEGNGRMTTSRPRVHVALLGIEKIIPRMRDLPAFLKIISRSTTGQPMGVYTTLINGPKREGEVDGPEEFHVVLLDNGRSQVWASEYREVLRCIRCGACLNACPVYRNVGGHAYNSVYPGPIGSLVTPLLNGIDDHAHLPRASSLCGACKVVCPVGIDIPKYLLKLRTTAIHTQPTTKRLGMKMWRWMMSSAGRYRLGQWWMRQFLGFGGREWTKGGFGLLGDWTYSRDLPTPPAESFRVRWAKGLSDE